ncbi:MAG TPA: DUF4386 domain-containing protein [Pyrinomonadaceae bacterium]|nr:DUF4386 domain-containing protein [Pyrinomonadaceae bacterium]
MISAQRTGRTIGFLLLLHLITGLMTPYMLLQQLSRPLTFSAIQSVNSFQVRLAIMMLFVGGAVPIFIAITGMPVFRKFSYALALWLFGLAIVNFALQGGEIAGYMSLFTFSQNYASANAADLAVHELVGATVRSAWKWIHYTHLLIMVGWMFSLGLMLWKSGLVPRVLAGLLLITTVLQITGITLPQFLAYPSPNLMLMGMPLGFIYLALSVWLMIKGFSTRDNEAAQ